MIKYTDRKITDFIQFDVELGNHNTFFSGRRTLSAYKNPSNIGTGFNLSFTAEIEDAKGIIIDEVAQLEKNTLRRKLSFLPQTGTQLFDFVSRYVVKSDVQYALINNKKIKHKCSNIYYQFPSSSVTVEVPVDDNSKLVFSEIDASKEDWFDNVFYLRDESVENGTYKWIVHHRKIVKIEHADLFLRGCNPRIEGIIPFQKFIPHFIKKSFFRIREVKYPNFPIMAVGVVNVSHCNLNLTTEVRLIDALSKKD